MVLAAVMCSIKPPSHFSIASPVIMEWSTKENRIAVIALHKCGMEKKKIFNTLKPLKINLRFVYRAIKLFEDTGDINDHERSGRPRIVRTPRAIAAVHSRLNRNPVRKQKILSQEMNISERSVSRIIGDDLRLGAYKRQTGQLLTAALKENRVKKCKRLLKKYGARRYKKILFTDEKIFTVQEKFNKQNDRVYARSAQEAATLVPRVEKGHHPASVMVWWGVSYDGVCSIHFCEKGVKTAAKNYQRDILNNVVKPLNETMFKNQPWTFQQDSAPAHKAKTTQEWLKNHLPDFISIEDWPSGSPDLNPLDYKLWSVLEDMVCHKRHRNLESLKEDLTEAVDNFPIYEVRTAIDEWPDRLRRCVEANGGHFE